MNFELMHRVIDHLRANPDLHDQGQWCGTAQCMAGWTTTLAGLPQKPVKEPFFAPSELRAVGLGDLGRGAHVETVAERLLGLDDVESGALFAGHLTVDDIERQVKDWENAAQAVALE